MQKIKSRKVEIKLIRVLVFDIIATVSKWQQKAFRNKPQKATFISYYSFLVPFFFSLVSLSPFLTSNHFPSRCRIPQGAACCGQQQPERPGQRHGLAAQRPHPGGLQLDPVLSGPHAEFSRGTIPDVIAEEVPEQRNPQDINSRLRATVWRPHGLPTGL